MTPETAFYRDIAVHFRTVDRERASGLLAVWPRLPELGLTVDAVLAACSGDFSSRAVFAAMMNLYARGRGKPFCGEKTPGHFRCISKMLTDFPDAKIFYLMRDGRDVALSLASMPFWRHDLATAANLWVRAAQACRAAQASHSDRVELVMYEDLAARPREVLRRLMPSLDLVFEESQLDSDIASGVVLPRSMEWKGQSLQRVDASRIGRRQQFASTEEARLLDELMRGDLDHFGYAT